MECAIYLERVRIIQDNTAADMVVMLVGNAKGVPCGWWNANAI